MRLGINYVIPHETPEQWADILSEKGYRASTFPVDYRASAGTIDAYKKAADEHNIIIAEVGVWNSPNHPNPAIAAKAREDCLEQLRLAEYIHANCCVNVSGAAGEVWYQFYKENYSKDLYKRNVEFIQYLCDTVNPKHTGYSLEPAPWMLPDSAAQYEQVLRDVNRPGQFRVHMDIFNFINHPYHFAHQEELIDDAFSRLGSRIASCHIKDVRMVGDISVMIEETEIGTGGGAHACYLEHIAALEHDVPVLIEHLECVEQYDRALAYLKKLMPENHI